MSLQEWASLPDASRGPCPIKPGDKVRWCRNPGAGSFEVTQVDPRGYWLRLEGGATAPMGMLEPVEDDAMMEVIEAQMVEIDRLVAEAPDWNEVRHKVGLLCMELGYDRIPRGPTGLATLDDLVAFVHGER